MVICFLNIYIFFGILIFSLILSADLPFFPKCNSFYLVSFLRILFPKLKIFIYGSKACYSLLKTSMNVYGIFMRFLKKILGLGFFDLFSQKIFLFFQNNGSNRKTAYSPVRLFISFVSFLLTPISLAFEKTCGEF